MLPQEHRTNLESQQAMLGDEFTPEEKARLTALRQRYLIHPEYRELGIDSRRLEFARWLVAHGRLDEGH
jgi:hypothetical protein